MKRSQIDDALDIHVKTQCNLAQTYVKQSRFLSAARVLEDLASDLRATANKQAGYKTI